MLDLAIASTNIPLQAQPVESSNINALGFNELLGLVVNFKNGSVYCYPGVHEGVLQELLNADSVGKKFIELIKSKNKPYIKLS